MGIAEDNPSKTKKLYGEVIAEARTPFGNLMRVYSRGFISIEGLWGTITIPEKLLSISLVDQPQLFAAGARPLLSGSKRDSTLIIVTQERSETIHFRDASNNQIANILRFIAVAQTALGDTRSSVRETDSSANEINPFATKEPAKNRKNKLKGERSLVLELNELKELHRAGDLTDEEFAKAKKKLLS